MLANIWSFVDERGRNPVREYLQGLPMKERAKVMAYLDELRRQGHNLRRPVADYVGHGIYELRPGANRVFYFFFLRDNAILVNAIRKKTDKLSQRDIELCVKRKLRIEEDERLGKVFQGEVL